MKPEMLEQAYQDVEQDALSQSQPQSRPKAILLGGQPGAGKSTLGQQAAHEMAQRGGAVWIDPDQLREYNPQYWTLLHEDPLHAADKTHPLAADWSKRLTRAGMDNQRNLVIDGTLRNTDDIQRLTQMLHDHGYEIDVRVIAVNDNVSMARSRLRFEKQVAETGAGRFVNLEQHDEAYQKIPDTIAMLEQQPYINDMTVYNADQQPIYSSRRPSGSDSAAHALISERERDWNEQDQADYAGLISQINGYLKQRHQAHVPAIPEDNLTLSYLRLGLADELRPDPPRTDPHEHAALRRNPCFTDKSDAFLNQISSQREQLQQSIRALPEAQQQQIMERFDAHISGHASEHPAPNRADSQITPRSHGR